jgi:hypothetical protein
MGGFTPVLRADPTLVSGTRDPGTTVSQRIIADVKDEIALYMPDSAPVMAITSHLRKKREATQYQYDWLTKDEYPRNVTTSIAYASGDVSIVLSAGQGDRIAVNYVLMNKRTREHILVTGVSTDTLTVVRGIGGIQEAMNAGDVLEFQRAVFEDGAGIGTLKSVKEDREFNYTEIIRTPFGFTGRQQNTSLYGGKDPNTERKWQGVEHSHSIENMLLFGRRHSRTGTGGKLQTFSGGIEYFLRSSVWNLNGNMPTERSFIEWLEYSMLYGKGGVLNGSKTKYLFCSGRWLTIIESWARDKIQYRPLDTRVGIKVGFFDTAHGTVILVRQPLFVGDHGGMAMLLDLNHVRYVYHQGRDTKLLDNRQANDVDGMQEEYFSDCGLELELEAAHGMAVGLPLA